MRSDREDMVIAVSRRHDRLVVLGVVAEEQQRADDRHDGTECQHRSGHPAERRDVGWRGGLCGQEPGSDLEAEPARTASTLAG